MPIWVQPIVHAAEPGQVLGYEALLRDRNHDGTRILPSRPQEVAARLGLNTALDHAGWRSTAEQVGGHAEPITIFVNVTPASIHDPAGCARSLPAFMAEAGIAPERVVLELATEREGDLRDASPIIAGWRRAGFRIALDDLGAPHGSLDLLELLRPDFVKIDRALIHGVDRNPFRATLAAGILATLAALDLPTIVEGVETEAEWHWARDHGVDYIQGWFFALPDWPPPAPRLPPDASAARVPNSG